MSGGHPVLHGFGKWLAWNTIIILLVWILVPKMNPVFLRVLISNFCGTATGCNYYSFFWFPWFIFFIGSFLWFILWPSMSKRSFLR